MKRLTFYVDKKMVDVFVEYKNNKHMYLKIKKKQLYCSVPNNILDITINKFIKKHIKTFVKIIEKSENNQKYSLIYDFLYFNGTKYFFQRLAGFNNSSIEICGNKMYIKTIDSSDSLVKNSIKKFLIFKIEEYLSINIPIWTNIMKLDVHIFSIMKRKSAWGLNIINKKHIKFSYYLMHFNKDIIDYVIVHELSHTLEPNHSKQFWNIVKKHINNYKDVKLLLKDNFDLNDI